MIRWFFSFFFILSLAIWVGSIVFFSVVVAPSVFTVLDRNAAGDLLSRIFPHYYWVGLGCGAVGLASLIFLFLLDSGNRFRRIFQMVVISIMLLFTLYASTILERQIHEVAQQRDTVLGRIAQEAEQRFQKLHGRSVVLNVAVLGFGVAALGSVAMRRRD